MLDNQSSGNPGEAPVTATPGSTAPDPASGPAGPAAAAWPPGYGQPPAYGGWGPTWFSGPGPYNPAPPIVLPGKPYVPGWGMYALTLVAVLLGLYASSLPNWDQATGAVAFLSCVTIGVVWIIAFIVTANDTRLRIDRRTWTRWAGIPIVGMLALALVGSNVPAEIRFGASRGALEQAAEDALAGHAPGQGWFGLVPVDSVRAFPDGVAIIVVSGAQGCGYAYHRDDALPGRSANADDWGTVDGGYTTSHFATNWWSWCPGEGGRD